MRDYSHLGDPDGMEALASELLLRAESVAGIVAALEREVREVREVTFEGPAAARLHEEMMRKRRRAERVAVELQESAHMLKRNAAGVRGEIYQLDLAARRERGSDV